MKKILLFFKKYFILLILLLYIVLAYAFNFVSCPIKLITGFPCPGCGITRACMALFKLDFIGAFNYYPCIYILPLLFIIILFKKRPFFEFIYNSKLFWISLILIIITSYILRMIFIYPNEPMTYNENNLILALYNWITSTFNK